MPDVSLHNLFAVALVAVLAPLLLGYVPRLRVPAVVLEILVGVAIGPSVLGWVEIDVPVSVLALLGLAFLLFLAGLEVDVHRLRGRLLLVALTGFAATLALGLLAGAAFRLAGWVSSPLLLAVALSATSLGLVVPVLKDAGQAATEVGRATVTGATVADVGAVILLTLLFSTSGGTTGGRLVLLAAFAALVVATVIVIRQAGRSMRLGDVLVSLQDTTAEIRVRLAVVLLVGFASLAETTGLETILGAFLAGAVVSTVDGDAASHPRFRVKLEAIGYGFLVPVFFVTSGLRLDLRGLLEEPAALARVPLFLLALLLVRGLPAVLYVPAVGPRAATAAGLLQATSLPFVVTAVEIGMQLGHISSVNGAALVLAGLLSVTLFPPVALGLLRRETRVTTDLLAGQRSTARTHRVRRP